MSMEERQDPTTSAEDKDRVLKRDDEADEVEGHAGPRTVRRPIHNTDDGGDDDVEGHVKVH